MLPLSAFYTLLDIPILCTHDTRMDFIIESKNKHFLNAFSRFNIKLRRGKGILPRRLGTKRVNDLQMNQPGPNLVGDKSESFQ